MIHILALCVAVVAASESDSDGVQLLQLELEHGAADGDHHNLHLDTSVQSNATRDEWLNNTHGRDSSKVLAMRLDLEYSNNPVELHAKSKKARHGPHLGHAKPKNGDVVVAEDAMVRQHMYVSVLRPMILVGGTLSFMLALLYWRASQEVSSSFNSRDSPKGAQEAASASNPGESSKAGEALLKQAQAPSVPKESAKPKQESPVVRCAGCKKRFRGFSRRGETKSKEVDKTRAKSQEIDDEGYATPCNIDNDNKDNSDANRPDVPDPALAEKFEASVRYIQSLPKDGPFQGTNEEKLKTYGLFKQASLGNNTTPKPSIFYLESYYKWDAWTKNMNMSKGQAMQEYIDYVQYLRQHYEAKYGHLRSSIPGADKF